MAISTSLALLVIAMCAVVYCSWPSDADRSWRYRWNYFGLPTFGLLALSRVVEGSSISFDVDSVLKALPVMLVVVALFAPAIKAAREARDFAG